MVLGGFELIIISIIITFVLISLFHQHEEGWLGRAAMVSVILGIGTYALSYGVIGYIIAIIISFAALIGIQKYSFLTAVLFLIAAETVSRIIVIGIHRYF